LFGFKILIIFGLKHNLLSKICFYFITSKGKNMLLLLPTHLYVYIAAYIDFGLDRVSLGIISKTGGKGILGLSGQIGWAVSYPYLSTPANRVTVSQSLKIRNTQGDMSLLARISSLASFRCPWRRFACNKSRSHSNNTIDGDDKYINSQPLPAKG